MDIAQRLRQNWKSGLTVSLVSIPLSVSLAVASQSTPTAGIITAVWAGLMAALLGGSHYNIVGPTGALSGLLASYAISHGADALPTLAVASGILILIAYVCKLERFLAFVPGSTIEGFTLGVAFIIGLNQFNYAFGLANLPKHEKFIENVLESFRHIGQTSGPALGLFVLFLIGMFAFLKLMPKVPGAIVLSPIGIVLGYLATSGRLPFQIETLASKYGDISNAIIQIPKPVIADDILGAAVSVAVVAILETMISAKIADGMTKTKHDERREMFGLGIANLASGMAGGIPATAALARTSLNIKSGANNRMSAFVSSVCIAAISVLLLGYFKYIPMAVIAAILVFVAVRMVEVSRFVRLFKHDKLNFWLALAVAAVTIYEDPIIGILAGAAVSLLVFMEKLSRGQFDLLTANTDQGQTKRIPAEELDMISGSSDILVYSIKGQLAYINSKAHISRFENGFNGHNHIVLRLRELYFVDQDGVEALEEIIELAKANKRDVLVSGPNELIDKQLAESSNEYRKLKKEGRIFSDTADALAYLGYEPSANPSVVHSKKPQVKTVQHYS